MADFKHRKHFDSFASAWRGIIISLQTQPNFQIMILATAVLIFAGAFFQLSQIEWVVLTVMVAVVFIAEMVNTSIEAMVDLITKEWREEAKIAKDVGGGMVLLSVFMSIIVGTIVFLPKLLRLFWPS